MSHTIEEVQYSVILLLPVEEVTGDDFGHKLYCLLARNSAGKVTIPLSNVSTLLFFFSPSFYSNNKLEYRLRSTGFLQSFLLSMFFFSKPEFSRFFLGDPEVC